jgi:hypothetical protein
VHYLCNNENTPALRYLGEMGILALRSLGEISWQMSAHSECPVESQLRRMKLYWCRPRNSI